MIYRLNTILTNYFFTTFLWRKDNKVFTSITPDVDTTHTFFIYNFILFKNYLITNLSLKHY